MKRFVILFGIAALGGGGVPSCKRADSELTGLVRRREEQKGEIVRLKAELSRLDADVKALPADPAPKLAEALKQLAAHRAEIPRLEADAAELGERRRALQREFDAYHSKYPAP